MLRDATLQPESGIDVDQWLARCRYWAEKADAPPLRKRRERRTEPLVLTGHGMSMRVDKGCLLLTGGNTHFPAKVVEHRFFKGELGLPPRIIAVDGSGSISLDALDWMDEQGIAFVRINYDGSHSMAISPNGYSAKPEKVRWQLETRDNPKSQLAFAAEMIRQKFEAAYQTLENFLPESDARNSAVEFTEKALMELPKAKSLSVLLSIEGKAALSGVSNRQTG